MKIDSYLERTIREYWEDKETLVVICARRLGDDMWDDDSMYGRTRNREDHEAKVAKLGLALGMSQTPEEFIERIKKIETVREQDEEFYRLLASHSVK